MCWDAEGREETGEAGPCDYLALIGLRNPLKGLRRDEQ